MNDPVVGSMTLKEAGWHLITGGGSFVIVNSPRDTDRPVREVGRRRQAPAGAPPPAENRAAVDRTARYRTRAPKGVFVYKSHEEANRDRDKWIVDAIAHVHRHD